MKIKLFFLSVTSLVFFAFFSYVVAKEQWQQIDFDLMVKLQDHIPGKFDNVFSYFSLLGSVEITAGACFILAFLALLRRKWWSVIGWLMIIPASVGEVMGKLLIFHPAPPYFFHKTVLPADLPTFYIHTNFSYPSGHMTRTIFIITILTCLLIISSKNAFFRLINLLLLGLVAFLMGITRVYLGEHWTSDVLGGALLGAGAGFFASVLILKSSRS